MENRICRRITIKINTQRIMMKKVKISKIKRTVKTITKMQKSVQKIQIVEYP